MRIARGARWLPPSPMDSWCRGALIASAVLAALSVLLVLDLQLRLQPRVFFGLALLWALPSWVQAVEDRLTASRGSEPTDLTVVLWLGLAAGLLLAAPVAWASLLAWPHGLALARGRRDVNAAVALGIGALLPMVAVAVYPSVPGATLSALALLVGAVGGTWVHARMVRRAFLRVGDSALAEPLDAAGLAARSLAAALLVGALLLASLGLEVGAAAKERLETRRTRVAAQAATGGTLTGPAAPGDTGSGLEGATDAGAASEAEVRAVWPEELALERVLQPGHPRRMAEVRSSLDDAGPHYGPDNPLYLRARAYDTLASGGLSLSSGATWETRTDADDGREEGWTRLRTPEGPVSTVSFALRQRAHRGGGNETYPELLLHTEPVLAVDSPDVRWAPGEGLYAREQQAGIRRLRWTAEQRRWPPRIATVSEVDPRYLQLPEDDVRFPTWIRDARARDAVAEDSEAVVARVLARFRSWRYTLEVSGSGADALQDFYLSRGGYCALYAAATLLELRASGVPCRVVSGYRVTRFDPAREDGRGLYVVDSDEAHAWVEVALADGSWRTIDPTPPRALQAALAGGDPADAAAGSEDGADAGLATTGGEGGSEGGPYGTGRTDGERDRFQPYAPEWLQRFVRKVGLPAGTGAHSGYAFALPIAVLLHFAVMRHIRRLDKLRGRHEDPDWTSTSGDWQRLLSVLAGYGFRMRRGQTPREFARAVRRGGGPLFAGMERVVETIYRRRWGGVGNPGAEREALAEYREVVASKAFRRRWEEQTGGGR